METSEVKLASIRLDGGTQPRAELREDVIEDYAEAMRAGAVFPPVVVYFDGEAYWLADGFHRVKAARRAGRSVIAAEVRQGTRRDAVLHSVGVNSDHGLRRTNADKRRAVTTMLLDEEWGKWSQTKIAEHCRVSREYVSRVRAQLVIDHKIRDGIVEVERGGTVFSMNTANIGQREKASDPDASAKDALAAASERRTARLAAALADAPAPVIEVARTYGVDEPELIEDLKRLHKSDGKPGSSDTFSEILATGYIQPGDEDEAVHITEGVEKVRAALRFKSDIHAQIGAAAKDQPWLSSESNEWYTPAQYIEAARRVMGGIDVDPASNEHANKTVRAATFYTKANSGLDKDWPGRVWLNPPYGGMSGPFVARLVEQFKAGITTEAIVLVNANSTETKWFAPLWDYTLCFTDHRIDFETPAGAKNGSTHGSVFVYLGKNVEAFAREFDQFGYVVARLRLQPAITVIDTEAEKAA